MLLYFIFIFEHEGVTPAKVALLLMPLVIELVLGEVMVKMMAMGLKLILAIDEHRRGRDDGVDLD
jgi:hypothetical protein